MITRLTDPFRKYKYLLIQLTLREIKGRYKQSIIGYAWILINPLSQLLVLSFVFSMIFKFPTGNIPYPIFLFVGLLPWTYLQSSLTAGTLSLVDNSELIKKVYFPREVFTYSTISAKTVDFFFSLLLLLIFMFFYHISIQLSIIYMFPIFLIQLILMTALSLLFSALNLFYRDIQFLINLVLMLWMYLTPIIYPVSLVPSEYLWLYKLNPMVGIIEGYRSALFNLPFDTNAILWSFSFSLFSFIVIYWVFKKWERLFADIV